LLLTALNERRQTEPRLGLDAEHPLQLWIGPEGGFSPEELALLSAAGAQPCHLGDLVLRTETAATAVLAIAGAVLGSCSELQSTAAATNAPK
jgi:RsmE family RNA methyltransferase